MFEITNERCLSGRKEYPKKCPEMHLINRPNPISINIEDRYAPAQENVRHCFYGEAYAGCFLMLAVILK